MTWILFALLAPVFFATTIIIDKYVIEKVSRGLFDYLLYFSGVALIISFLVFIFFNVIFDGIGFYSFFGGILLTPATYFYVKAIETEDVSLVTPVFNMIPVFLLLLAYFVYGEMITGYQLLSFFIILIGSIVVSTEIKFIKQFKFTKGFYLMLFSSFIYAIIFTIGDYVVKSTNVATVTFWEGIGIFISTIFLFFNKKTKNEIILGIKDFSLFKVFSYIGIVVSDKLGFAFTYLAFSLSVSPGLVYVVEGVQPFILLLFTVLLTIFFPKVIKENIDKKVIL